MTSRRRLLGLLAAGLGVGALAACGRKGRPVEPEDAVYPRTYPYTPHPGATAARRQTAPAPSDTDQTP